MDSPSHRIPSHCIARGRPLSPSERLASRIPLPRARNLNAPPGARQTFQHALPGGIPDCRLPARLCIEVLPGGRHNDHPNLTISLTHIAP